MGTFQIKDKSLFTAVSGDKILVQRADNSVIRVNASDFLGSGGGAAGSADAVQLSDGAGGFVADSNFNFDTTNKILKAKGKDSVGSVVVDVTDSSDASIFQVFTNGNQKWGSFNLNIDNSSIAISNVLITSLPDSTVLFGFNTGNSGMIGTRNVLLGDSIGGILTSGGQNVLIGFQAGGTGFNGGNCVVIGNQANVGSTANSQIAVGRGAGSTANFNGSIAIGTNSRSTSTNQFIVGSNSHPITKFILGSGAEHNGIDGDGITATWFGAGAFDSGAVARNGGDIELRGGEKQNAGTEGSVKIQTFAGVTRIESDSIGLGFFGSTPIAKPSAYSLTATAVLDKVLLASAGASTINNNNVLAQLITDLQQLGLIS